MCEVGVWVSKRVRWNGLPWNTFLFIYVFLPQLISFVTFSTTTTSQNANAAKIAAKLFRWIIATNFASCCAAFDSLCNSGNNFTLLFMQPGEWVRVTDCERESESARSIDTRVYFDLPPPYQIECQWKPAAKIECITTTMRANWGEANLRVRLCALKSRLKLKP